MAIPSKVQSATGSNALASSRVYPTNLTSWATPSNLNLVTVEVMKTGSGSITGPLGWTICANYEASPNVQIWCRIIDGSETTYTWSWATATSCSMHAQEWTAGPGGIWVPYDSKQNGATVTGTALGTGLTGVLTTASQVLVTALACSNTFSGEAVGGGPAWTTPVHTQNNATSDAVVDVNTSVAASWSWVTSRTARAAIAAFYAKYPRAAGSVGGLSTVPSTTPLASSGMI